MNQGLLAPNNPNEVEKSPESGGVPAHRRYSDFGDFSICGAAAEKKQKILRFIAKVDEI